MKAIVGIDGSAGSWDAIREASRWLIANRDDLLLYYSPPRIRVSTVRQASEDVENRARGALTKSVLDEARQRLPEAFRNRAQMTLGTGDPRYELPKLAEENKAGLIVVGARGLGPIRALLLGSVSQSLARYSKTPVLVARGKHDRVTEPGTKVLMAIDEVPTSRATLDLLTRLNWDSVTSARLMHVVESLFGGEIPHWLAERAEYATDEAQARAYLEQQEATKRHKFKELEDYRQKLPRAFHRDPPIVIGGYPAERILETAAADDIDLIILGAKTMSRFERLLLGSTAERVLTHAPCSVLLIHHEP
jgi:nucleotide-binding universal stress UspA family protein